MFLPFFSQTVSNTTSNLSALHVNLKDYIKPCRLDLVLLIKVETNSSASFTQHIYLTLHRKRTPPSSVLQRSRCVRWGALPGCSYWGRSGRRSHSQTTDTQTRTQVKINLNPNQINKMLDLKHLLEHKDTVDKKQTKPDKLDNRKSYSQPRQMCRGILPGIPWLFHVWERSGASCCRISLCGSLSKLREVEAVWCSEVQSSLHHISTSEPTRPLSVDYWSDPTAVAAPLPIPPSACSKLWQDRIYI